MNCTSCNQDIAGQYCGHCGAPAVLKRVDGHYILHEVQHVLHFEKGIGYTVRELLLRPGQAVRTFLTENRNRLVKPVIYLVITSLFYTLVSHLFPTAAPAAAGHQGSGAVQEWVTHHYGYANIIMGIFIAGWLKVFNRKSPYNFYEILIMLCFVMGTGMLLYTVFCAVERTAGLHGDMITGVLMLIYCTWAVGQFTNGKKAGDYVRAFFAYALGMITFDLLVMLADHLLGGLLHT